MKRADKRMRLNVSSDKILSSVKLRLGAFRELSDNTKVMVNGKAVKSSVQHSGDSWWVTFDVPEGYQKLQSDSRVVSVARYGMVRIGLL